MWSQGEGTALSKLNVGEIRDVTRTVTWVWSQWQNSERMTLLVFLQHPRYHRSRNYWRCDSCVTEEGSMITLQVLQSGVSRREKEDGRQTQKQKQQHKEWKWLLWVSGPPPPVKLNMPRVIEFEANHQGEVIDNLWLFVSRNIWNLLLQTHLSQKLTSSCLG